MLQLKPQNRLLCFSLQNTGQSQLVLLLSIVNNKKTHKHNNKFQTYKQTLVICRTHPQLAVQSVVEHGLRRYEPLFSLTSQEFVEFWNSSIGKAKDSNSQQNVIFFNSKHKHTTNTNTHKSIDSKRIGCNSFTDKPNFRIL